MLVPRYFGPPERQLYGALHRPSGPVRSGLLICPPLLQEYPRTHRALWSLAEDLAANGIAVLRFDYAGTGDSAGDSSLLNVPGAVSDILAAREHLIAQSGVSQPRLMSLRSSSLLLLQAVAQSTQPADIVLWDAQLDGAKIVARWHAQHAQQFLGGRYHYRQRPVAQGELLGLRLDPHFLTSMEMQKAHDIALPRGSRVEFASWGDNPSQALYTTNWKAAGIGVSALALAADEPDWENPKQFEAMVFPRRSVKSLAKHFVEGAPSR